MTTSSATARRSPMARVRRELGAFPRQFWMLMAGVLVLITGVDTCYPFETSYLNRELGIPMTTVGLVLGLPILATLPLHIVGGAFTDRFGRKPAMVVGISVVTVLYVTFTVTTSLWPIAVAIIMDAGFGWALFLTGSNAMVADLVAYERRAEAYSMTRVAVHMGMVVGPLLAGLLIVVTGTYRSLFFIGAGLCLAFIVLVLVSVNETRPGPAASRATFAATLHGYARVLADRRFLAFCGLALFPLYGFGQIWSILPVALHDTHGVSARNWGFLLAVYGGTVALLQYPLIRLLQHRDHLVLMALSSVLLCGGLAGTMLAPWGFLTFLCVVTLGFGVMLLIPISSALAAALAPSHLRGRYMGTWTLMQMGGYAFGPTFGGLALDQLGGTGAALVIASSGVLGCAFFVALRRRLRPPVAEAAPALPPILPPDHPPA